MNAIYKATVPLCSVVVRKAYGAGLYAMSGPAFEPDCTIALPTAKIAVMGPSAAINAVYYNQLQAIEDEAERDTKRQEQFVAPRMDCGRQVVPRLRHPAKIPPFTTWACVTQPTAGQ